MTELVLRDLGIQVGDRTLVDGVGLTLRGGEFVALVGASGSGKTLTCRSLLGLVDLVPGVVRGDLELHTEAGVVRPRMGGVGRRQRDRGFTGVRGDLVGYIPQQAPAALDPLVRVGAQVRAAARLGGNDEVLPWLERAGFGSEDCADIASLWPHQLSGGMAQRVVIAQTLARGSRFIVADEPTTGLDAVIQRRIVDGLRRLADEGLGVLMVTHDLRLVQDFADRVYLMESGRLAESWSETPAEATSEAGRRLLSALREAPW